MNTGSSDLLAAFLICFNARGATHFSEARNDFLKSLSTGSVFSGACLVHEHASVEESAGLGFSSDAAEGRRIEERLQQLRLKCS